MAESTLINQYADFRRAFGFVFGLGRDPSNDWSANTVQDVQDCMDEGMKTFLRADGKHKWSFMYMIGTLTVFADIATTSGDTVSGGAYADPSTTLTISGGNTTMYPGMVGRSIVITGVGTFTISGYTSGTVITVTGDASSASGATFSITTDGFFRLPDNVAGIDGPLEFDEDESYRHHNIPLVSHGSLLNLRRQVDYTGYPQYAALVPAISSQTETAKWDLYTYPDVGGTYALKYKYRIRPDALTSTLTDPYGSGEHGDTLKYAMLAAWERLIDENPDGPINRHYQNLLATSIEQDKRLARAEYAGRMHTDPPRSGHNGADSRNLRSTITFDGSAIP